MSLRRKWTVNPWFWARIICWLRGHNHIQVIGLHFTDASGSMCRRCLKEWLTNSVEPGAYQTEASQWEQYAFVMQSALTNVETLIQDFADEINIWGYHHHSSPERRAYERVRLTLGDVQAALDYQAPAESRPNQLSEEGAPKK